MRGRNKNFSELRSAKGKGLELAQHRFELQAFSLSVFSLRVLLPKILLISKMDLSKTVCEDWRSIEMALELCPMAGFGISSAEPSGLLTER